MFSHPKILFLVSLLFVALLNPKFNPYLPVKFLIFYHSSIYIYLIVIPWAQVVCLIYTPEARGPQARGLRVYISGEPRVHMV